MFPAYQKIITVHLFIPIPLYEQLLSLLEEQRFVEIFLTPLEVCFEIRYCILPQQDLSSHREIRVQNFLLFMGCNKRPFSIFFTDPVPKWNYAKSWDRPNGIKEKKQSRFKDPVLAANRSNREKRDSFTFNNDVIHKLRWSQNTTVLYLKNTIYVFLVSAT